METVSKQRNWRFRQFNAHQGQTEGIASSQALPTFCAAQTFRPWPSGGARAAIGPAHVNSAEAGDLISDDRITYTDDDATRLWLEENDL